MKVLNHHEMDLVAGGLGGEMFNGLGETLTTVVCGSIALGLIGGMAVGMATLYTCQYLMRE